MEPPLVNLLLYYPSIISFSSFSINLCVGSLSDRASSIEPMRPFNLHVNQYFSLFWRHCNKFTASC